MLAKSMKSSAFALIASVFGFAAAPAFAQNGASVIQTSDQNTVQQGSGNVSIQGNVQTGVVTQAGSPYGYGVQCFVAPCPSGGINGASVVQQNQQDVAQFGHGNTAIQGNSSAATVHQGNFGFPYTPYSINGANVIQDNQQSIGQFGFGNNAVQGNAADAQVIQH